MSRARRGWPTVVVAAALGACTPSDQQNAAIGSQSGGAIAAAGVRTEALMPGRPGRVFVFAGVDAACRPLPAPELTVARAPQKGDVTFKPGQPTTIAASAAGTCKGAAATGTGVYYTARSGASGADAFAVSARLASGETMVRDFSVKIAE